VGAEERSEPSLLSLEARGTISDIDDRKGRLAVPGGASGRRRSCLLRPDSGIEPLGSPEVIDIHSAGSS
jgi:hypothetical protein